MLVIGSDHAGYALKQQVLAYLTEEGVLFNDMGCYDEDAVDYPDIANALAAQVSSGEFEKGILICGTGIGMSIAANKHKGVRAAVCHDCYSARMARAHNDINVLSLGSRVLGGGLAVDIVEIFLNTEFDGGRHKRRIDKLLNI